MFNRIAGPTSPSASQLPSRDQLDPRYQWHLNDIYANDAAWQESFEQLKTKLPAVAEYRGKLGQSAKAILDCLKARDEVGIMSGKLFAYARMHRDENSANTNYQALTDRMESLAAEAGAVVAFIEPELLALPDETLKKYYEQEPGLKEYGFYFENLARQKKHVLSPKEEELLSRAGDVTQAAENIFNMLAHADLTFPEIADEKGNNVQLSEGRYLTFIKSPDRRVRRDAFTKLLNTYNDFRNTFAATLGSNVKKNVFYAKVRNYSSTLQSALEGDNVPAAVYDNLIASVHNNLTPLHRYCSLKKKALKLDELHMYDLYVSLVQNSSMKFSYEGARKIVLEGLMPLGTEYASILQKGLQSGWVDVYENKGKQTGAYAWGVYSVHPFVLLNYHDNYNDVSTLAHEMGHAIHSYYSQSNQPYATSQYTIFTAEVASTTNEILLLDDMLKKTKNKQQHMYLLNQYLETVRGTIYRQTMFAEFEKLLYAKAENGESITADMLDALWHELNVTYYGPDMVVDTSIDVEWARIPHFYWNFYVYQYVTGYSAATALAQQILEQGQPAQQRYINFLKSGGSNYPIELLKQAGVDMSSPKPVEITLQKFTERLDELEKLLTR